MVSNVIGYATILILKSIALFLKAISTILYWEWWVKKSIVLTEFVLEIKDRDIKLYRTSLDFI